MAYASVKLTGWYQMVDGSAASGFVKIIPSEDVILDADGKAILTGHKTIDLVETTRQKADPDTGEPMTDPVTGEPVMESGGALEVDLPATDDPNLNPTGFGYTVAARLHHQHIDAVSFQLPAAVPTVDITEVTQVEPSTFDPTVPYVTEGDLATVATSGAYGDLAGLPTIPSTADDVGAVGKSELIFNVTDPAFGATGDGSTNDASAINAALSAANAAAGFAPAVVWLPYTSTGYAAGAIVLKSNVTLRGENRVQLKRTGSATSQFITTAGSSNTRVEGLTIDPNGLANVAGIRISTGSTGITVRDCKLVDSAQPVGVHAIDTQASTTDLIIEDCWFDGLPNNIRMNQGPQRVTIRRNLFTGWSERCIYVLGNATQAIADLTIESNFVRDMTPGGSTRQPITVQGVDTAFHQRVKFNYNTVLGPGDAYNLGGTADQLSLHRCEDFEAIGNISVGSGDVGFTIAQQCHRGVVANNVVIGANSCGIALGSSTSSYVRDVTLNGNVCMNNGQNEAGDRPNNRQGIWMRNASNVVTGANVLGDDQGTKTQQYGIGLVDCTNVVAGIDLDAGNSLAMYDTTVGTQTNCTQPATPVALGA